MRQHPIFVVGETVGSTEVLTIPPSGNCGCKCLKCMRPFLRTIASLNSAKYTGADAACKKCTKQTRRKGLASLSRKACGMWDRVQPDEVRA